MDKVKGLFTEVKMEMLKIALIYSFLDSVMLFFVIYFIASFFNIKFLYTLLIPGIITFIFFVIRFVSKVNKMRLKDMEDANPQLKEMLRTAHDNQNEQNPLMDALFLELKGKMRTASSGNLLESKKIIARIISAVVIVFLIVFVSSVNVNLKKIDIPFEKLKFLVPNGQNHQEGKITDLVFNQTDVIYGDASIAKLGNDKININVNPTMSEIDLNNIKEAENNALRESEVESEVSVNPDAFNNQKLSEDANGTTNYLLRCKDNKCG
jgi:hypothetical protein